MMPPQSNAVLDVETLAHAVLELCKREPRFHPIVLQHGIPSLRQSIGGLEGLLQIVTEQFLSLAAAGAIWSRLVVKLQPFTAETILACPASAPGLSKWAAFLTRCGPLRCQARPTALQNPATHN